MNQKQKVLNVLQEGRQLTAKQIGAQFNIASPRKVVSLLRQEGHAIYLNKHTDTKGRETLKYRLGTPSRRMVAAAVALLGADALFSRV
jgi:transcription initiation factor IIE alpha subunit